MTATTAAAPPILPSAAPRRSTQQGSAGAASLCCFADPLSSALLYRASRFTCRVLGLARSFLAQPTSRRCGTVGCRSGFALDAAFQLFRFALHSLRSITHDVSLL